jgi:CTP:molybdopterin cytidylyltransferase MocA
MNARVLITAAGASRRMGRCKALLRCGVEAAFERIARLARDCTELAPVLITGADHDAIAAAVAAAPATAGRLELLHNPDWERGRVGGIALAVRTYRPHSALIWPVDCPLVAAETLAALRLRWDELGRPTRGWLAPGCAVDGVRHYGHPVWLGEELLSELVEADPALALRELRRRADPLVGLPVQDRAVLDDFDTPADLGARGF